MAEALGTAIGVIGFIGQLFDGCVKAYGYFTTAANLDADSQKMMCKVKIEEMRLVVWGREWGVAEGRFDEHLSERNPQLRVLATQILEQLHGTVTDFKKLQDRYGLVDEAGGGKETELSPSPPPPRKGSRDEGRRTNGFKTMTVSVSERSWRKEIGLRTKWVIGGEQHIQNLRVICVDADILPLNRQRQVYQSLEGSQRYFIFHLTYTLSPFHIQLLSLTNIMILG